MGLYLVNPSDFTTVWGNNVSFNEYTGIVVHSSNSIIIDNYVSNNDKGLQCSRSMNNTIKENNINNNRYGINIQLSSNYTISNNDVWYNEKGIYFSSSTNNNLLENNISFSNNKGLEFYNSSNINITKNNVLNNNHGFYLRQSSAITFLNNNISYNNIGIQTDFDLDQILINGNDFTFNNESSIAFYSSKNSVISKNFVLSGRDGISLSETANTSLVNNNVSSCNSSIRIISSSNITFSYNDVLNNYRGISFVSSSNNTVIGNNAINNYFSGLSLTNVSYSLVSENNLLSNKYGINIGSSKDNIITNNNVISNNVDGFYLGSSSNNIIKGNNVSSNLKSGFYSMNSFNNSIYHNNIVNNTKQAFDNGDSNQWDNGYPLGGNYWSDYEGIDIFNGPSQNISGSDNIGDFPYDIDSDSSDNFPLMEPIPDTLAPRIQLISPDNNATITSGTILDFLIYDGNLNSANYSINGGEIMPLSDPHNISTSGFIDGNYTIIVTADDLFGNSASSIYYFKIDSIPPSIWFAPEINHSTISASTTITLNVSGEDIKNVTYYLDQNELNMLSYPYIINTSGWSNGSYKIFIKAEDFAGNSNIKWFEINIDGISPQIISTSPLHNSIDIDLNATITLIFSEPIDQQNVENFITIAPFINYELYWDSTRTILTISFTNNNLTKGTTYSISVGSQVTDINGNSMESDFILVFTTKSAAPLDTDGDGIPDIDDPDDDNDGIPDEKDEFPLDPKKGGEDTQGDFTFIILFIVIAVIISLILVMLFLKQKKGKGEVSEIEPLEIGQDELPPPPPPPLNP
jgi:parallel beta-helix repeat protein